MRNYFLGLCLLFALCFTACSHSDDSVDVLIIGGGASGVTAGIQSARMGAATLIVEETEWHRIVFFGKQAETIQRYLRKGSAVYVEGRLRTRKWEKDGVTHYATEIMGEI